MKYPVKAEEIIAFGKQYFEEDGREFTTLDEEFVTAVVNLVNRAYQQGQDDAKSTDQTATA